MVSASSIGGLDMNEEEKSLYKRLLKSRFKKMSQQQEQQEPEPQPQQEKIYEQYG